MGYASTSRSLAMLEMLVHVTRENVPLDAVLVPIDVPDELVAELPDLPRGWNDFPYSDESRRVGDRWVKRSSSLAMLVPSAVLPAERNVLINPAHGHFNRIRVGEPEPDAFDRRLFGMQ
jgi:RES domain-containing protein